MNIIIFLVLLFIFTIEAKGSSVGTSTEKNVTETSENVSNQGTSTPSTEMPHTTSYNTDSTLKPTNSYSTSHFNQGTSTPSTEMPHTTSYNTDSTLKPTNCLSSSCGKTSTYASSTEMNGNMSHNTSVTMPSTSSENVLWNIFLNTETILIFMLGVIFSTVIFSIALCIMAVCKRCKTTDANNDKETIILEAVKSEHDQSEMQSDGHQADEQAPLQVHAPVTVSTNTSELNGGTDEEMKILGKEQTEGAGDTDELNYASINYSLLQKKDDGALMIQKVESDYAEIQLKKPSEGDNVETFSDKEKQDKLIQDAVNQGLNSEMVSSKQVDSAEFTGLQV